MTAPAAPDPAGLDLDLEAEADQAAGAANVETDVDLAPVPDLDADLAGGIGRLVDALLAAAEDTDRARQLPRSHFAAISALGLYGMVVGQDRGGLGFGPAQIRGVLRRLGSGCGATAFAFAQHHGTTGAVASSANAELRDRWLPGLTSDVLAGIAYAHVRRAGPPVLVAEPDESSQGTWILRGEAPWVTSWGLADVIGVAAQTADGRLVWSLVPAREGDGLSVGQRFELSVLGATATVALRFDDYRVDPEWLISVVDFGPWAEHDRHLAARPNPLCLGIGDRALAMLAELDQDRAARLAPGWRRLSNRAEAQARAVDQRRAVEATVARARAETVLSTQRLTAALLATVGGRGMERGHPAQRLHRESGFYVVQAQTAAGRKALLDEVIEGF